jgi:hypothetical protein
VKLRSQKPPLPVLFPASRSRNCGAPQQSHGQRERFLVSAPPRGTGLRHLTSYPSSSAALVSRSVAARFSPNPFSGTAIRRRISVILKLSCSVLFRIVSSAPLPQCRWSRGCRVHSIFRLCHAQATVSKCTRQPELWTDVHSGDSFLLYQGICINSEPGREAVLQIARATDACKFYTGPNTTDSESD